MTFDYKQTQEEKDEEERKFNAIIAHLEEQKRLENPTPESPEEIRALVLALRETLHDLPAPDENDDIAMLRHQANVLDHAFRRLIMDADTTYEITDKVDCEPYKYAAAFKAQDQYRRTVKTIHALRAQQKVNKRRGRRPKKTH